MKRINLLIVLFLFIGYTGNTQVKDISVTISPAAEYTFWDNIAGLEDGLLYGGRIGFGFGEYMELRGVYLKSYDLKTNFENFGLANYDNSLFDPQNVTLIRWGGELKANIGTNKLMPYITLGTGIQTIEMTGSDKFEHIYASVGLGIKVNIFPRAVFLLEAKNTTYSFNAANLLTSTDKTNFGVNDADFVNQRLSNWAVQGALQFYLGGRKPGTMTELDQAYLDKFSDGLRGIQFIIEPGANYIAFDANSQYKDTWLVGGYAGLDFNDFIGIRGFYFNAVNKLELTTDFDNLSMYGMEFRARLNYGSGITPYLTLGGGYLNPKDNYLGKEGTTVKGGEFATGGLGLNIPLGKRVLISGGARAMITSSEDFMDIAVPDQLQTHIMYNAGIQFTLGKKSKSTDEIYQKTLNMEVEKQMAENNLQIQQMKSDYQVRERALQKELQIAYEAKDVDKAVELMEEKNEVQASLKEIEKLEGVQVNKQKDYNTSAAGTTSQVENVVQIKMTPLEFESLIARILEATSKTRDTNLKSAPVMVGEQIKEPESQQRQIDLLNNRIEGLEKLLKDINEKNELDKSSDTSIRILEELEVLNKKLESNSVYNEEGNKPQTIIVTPAERDKDGNITTIDESGKVISSEPITDTYKRFVYKNSSLMFGINLGGETATTLGARLHYDIKDTPLEFMPELFIGLGDNTSYGISGNVIYPLKLGNGKVVPYAGIGLGIAKINKELRGNYNIILGAQLPFLIKNLSVDYTMRNTFDYNQFVINYRIPF